MHRRLTSLSLAALAITQPAAAASVYVSPDVPSVLGGSMHLPWEVVRNDAGSYTTALNLPAGMTIDGLHRMDSGAWLLSFEAPTTLDGNTYDPADVVLSDGALSGMFFDASAAGIPPGANVDSLILDDGDLILGFNVPTTIGGPTYDASDLVRYDGVTFSLFFDASAAGIPQSSNVVGADVRDGKTIVTFDIPTTLGGATYLPGELVAWDAPSFSSFYVDALWPPSSVANALGFLADPGRVPSITVEKSPIADGLVIVSWTPSCSAGAEDYGIYEGQVGNWTSHVQVDCTDDGGDLSEQVTVSPGDNYYLVVPHNANDEGSYGLDGNGIERPPGSPACVATQTTGPCP